MSNNIDRTLFYPTPEQGWRDAYFNSPCAELTELNKFFPPFSFNAMTVGGLRGRELECEREYPLVDVGLSMRGAAADLISRRFMHPSWLDLPAGGYRRHRTEGFGRGEVRRLKSGLFSLRSLYLEHALDLLAPALAPLVYSPPAMRHL